MDTVFKKIKNTSNIFSVYTIIFLTLYLIYNWKLMPDIIAMQFDIFGNPVSYFPKQNILYIFCILSVFCMTAVFVSSTEDEINDEAGEIKNSVAAVFGTILSVFSSYLVIRYSNSKSIQKFMIYVFVFFEGIDLIMGQYLIIKRKNPDIY